MKESGDIISAHAACNVNQHDRFVWGPRWPREGDNWRGMGLQLLQRHGEFPKETVRTHPGPLDPQFPHVAVVSQPVKTSHWSSGSSWPI